MGTGTASISRRIGKGIRIALYPFVLLILVIGAFALILVPIGNAYAGIASLVFTDRTPQFDNPNLTLYGDEVEEVEVGKTPLLGQLYASISIPSAGIEAPVYYGTGIDALGVGVGTFTGTWMPGQGRSIVMMAHNNTFFATLPQVQQGDTVTVTADYGTYEYTVVSTEIVLYSDETAIDSVMNATSETLVLYTCHNSMSIGATPYRFVAKCIPTEEYQANVAAAAAAEEAEAENEDTTTEDTAGQSGE
jgi:sortase A